MLSSKQLSLDTLQLPSKLNTEFLFDSLLSVHNLLGWNGIDLEYYQVPAIIGRQTDRHLVLVFFSSGKIQQKFQGYTQFDTVVPGSVISIPALICDRISLVATIKLCGNNYQTTCDRTSRSRTQFSITG